MTVSPDPPPLSGALGIPGASAVSLLDPDGPRVLWWAGGAPPDEQEASAAVTLAAAAAGLVLIGGPGDELGDVLVTSGEAFHVVRLVDDEQPLVAHLTLGRAGANLAMARREFGSLVEAYARQSGSRPAANSGSTPPGGGRPFGTQPFGDLALPGDGPIAGGGDASGPAGPREADPSGGAPGVGPADLSGSDSLSGSADSLGGAPGFGAAEQLGGAPSLGATEPLGGAPGFGAAGPGGTPPGNPASTGGSGRRNGAAPAIGGPDFDAVGPSGVARTNGSAHADDAAHADGGGGPGQLTAGLPRRHRIDQPAPAATDTPDLLSLLGRPYATDDDILDRVLTALRQL